MNVIGVIRSTALSGRGCRLKSAFQAVLAVKAMCLVRFRDAARRSVRPRCHLLDKPPRQSGVRPIAVRPGP